MTTTDDTNCFNAMRCQFGQRLEVNRSREDNPIVPYIIHIMLGQAVGVTEPLVHKQPQLWFLGGYMCNYSVLAIYVTVKLKK